MLFISFNLYRSHSGAITYMDKWISDGLASLSNYLISCLREEKSKCSCLKKELF